MTENDRHNYINYLGIAFYVVGGLTCICSLIPFIHVFIGILAMTGHMDPPQGQGAPPPLMFGVMFTGIGGCAILFGQAIGFVQIMTGRFLQQRRNHTFIVVVASISCISFPIGTALGVLTLVVIVPDEAKALFNHNALA